MENRSFAAHALHVTTQTSFGVLITGLLDIAVLDNIEISDSTITKEIGGSRGRTADLCVSGGEVRT